MANYDPTFSYIFITLYVYIDKTWQPSTTRLATLVRCLFALFPPSSMRFTRWTIGMKFAARRRISNPHRYPCVLCIPLYFPWEYLPGRFERNETDPVRGNADCTLREGAWEMFWEDRLGGKWNFSGRGREKIAPFGKRIDIIVVIPLFTIGAQMYNL